MSDPIMVDVVCPECGGMGSYVVRDGVVRCDRNGGLGCNGKGYTSARLAPDSFVARQVAHSMAVMAERDAELVGDTVTLAQMGKHALARFAARDTETALRAHKDYRSPEDAP